MKIGRKIRKLDSATIRHTAVIKGQNGNWENDAQITLAKWKAIMYASEVIATLFKIVLEILPMLKNN